MLQRNVSNTYLEGGERCGLDSDLASGTITGSRGSTCNHEQVWEYGKEGEGVYHIESILTIESSARFLCSQYKMTMTHQHICAPYNVNTFELCVILCDT